MVAVTPAVEPPDVAVRLKDGAESGLASIVQQYLEHDLAEFADKRRLAQRLRGRLAMTADDYGTAVTVEFRGDEIAIWDGERPPLDASIAGPYRGLTRLLQGETNPLVEHLRGRLRVRSTLRKPLFPFHVHSLMKLPPERGERRNHLAWAALLTAGGFAIGGAIALAIWLT
jgi:putative sterol carrier protein